MTTGRKPKKNLAVRPTVAEAFRDVARHERIQLSDLLVDMFKLWLSKKRKGRYPEVEEFLNDDRG